MTVTLNRADCTSAERTPTWPRRKLQTAARSNRRRHAARQIARLTTYFLIDVGGVAAALLVMLVLHPAGGWGGMVRSYAPAAGWLSVMAQHVIVVCSGLYLLGAYDEGDAVTDPRRVVSGVALGLLVLYWPTVWSEPSTLVTAYPLSALCVGAAVWINRRVSSAWFPVVWRGGIEPARALVLGHADDMDGAMHKSPFTGPNAVVAVALLDMSSRRRPVAGAYQTLETTLQSAIHAHDVDTIVLCSRVDEGELRRVVETAEAAGCRVLSLSRAFHLARRGPSLVSYGRTPVVELTQPGLRGRDVALKRVVDVVVAAAVLLVLSPVLLIVALLVSYSSPGPVLFLQERVGYRGRVFRIIKFRTMRVGAEQQVEELRDESLYRDPRLFKLVNDPRVTTLGRFLRRSSIDELPQLFNVLSGSMSLVGPRPPLPREVALYGDSSYLRFDVKPGITGPWQVNGRSTITSFDEVIALESAYVSGWTIWRDFAILARTIPAVLRMEGAH